MSNQYSGMDQDQHIEAQCLTPITSPGPHDIVFGRGGQTNHHRGNIRFRQMALEYRAEYQAAVKIGKPVVARKLVARWRSLDPPGRFLTKVASGDAWVDVGDNQAQKRASKSLGERAAMKRDRPESPPVATGTGNDKMDSPRNRKKRAGVSVTSPQSDYENSSFLPVLELDPSSFSPLGGRHAKQNLAGAYSRASRSGRSSPTYSRVSFGTGGSDRMIGLASASELVQLQMQKVPCNNQQTVGAINRDQKTTNKDCLPIDQDMIIDSLQRGVLPTAAELVESAFSSSGDCDSDGTSSEERYPI